MVPSSAGWVIGTRRPWPMRVTVTELVAVMSPPSSDHCADTLPR